MQQTLGSPIVLEVQVNDPVFDQILALWRTHSDTLGFMPLGGFEDAAQKRTLLAAIDTSRQLCGYVLYRKSSSQIAITHLCVAPSARGKGIARLLTDELSQRHRDSIGIGIWCRRDFSANQVWQHCNI
jgi:ribosomal protein S18 acetylase RimI-like enzyme